MRSILLLIMNPNETDTKVHIDLHVDDQLEALILCFLIAINSLVGC